MLQRVKELRGDRIRANDGDIGRVTDVYFDDEQWRVRYFVADTGGWLSGRKVLISPAAVDSARSAGDALAVDLSRKQVETSPGVEADEPVSRQQEEAFARHYGYSLYWAQSEDATLSTRERARKRDRELEHAGQEARRSHLRSSEEVMGYTLRAADGELGRIDDIVVDDREWSLAEFVVDVGDTVPGRRVRVPVSAVEAIDWKSREVRIGIPRVELSRAGQALG